MLAAAALLLALGADVAPEPLAPPPEPVVERLLSPNGRIAVVVKTEPGLSYDVLLDGKPLLVGATLSLDVEGFHMGVSKQVAFVERTGARTTVTPPVRQTADVLTDSHNDLRITFAGRYVVVFRAYDL